MSIGTILLIILVVILLGGFSGFGGGPFYGTGYYGGGGLGLVIVILLILSYSAGFEERATVAYTIRNRRCLCRTTRPFSDGIRNFLRNNLSSLQLGVRPRGKSDALGRQYKNTGGSYR